jgi:hypothetical protein
VGPEGLEHKYHSIQLNSKFYKKYGEVTASKHGSLTFPAAHT